MNEHPEDFRNATLRRQAVAHEEMVRGNPEPFIRMWSRREPVSLFGAWGPCQTGWERLVRTFRWVGSRYSGGTAATSVVEVLGVTNWPTQSATRDRWPLSTAHRRDQ